MVASSGLQWLKTLLSVVAEGSVNPERGGERGRSWIARRLPCDHPGLEMPATAIQRRRGWS